MGVVLSVIAIMVMLIVPNYTSWRTSMSLKAASRDIYTAMQEAKLVAIKRNADTAVVFDSANNRCYVCDDPGADGSWTGPGDLTGTGDNNILNTIDLSTYNVAIQFGATSVPAGNSVSGGALPGDGISYSSDCLTMNPRGTGKSGYVYIEDQATTKTYAVGTQSSGLVRLLKWEGGNWK